MKNSIFLFLLLNLALTFLNPLKGQDKLPVKLGIKASPNLGFILPDTRNYEYDGLKGGAIIGLISDIYFTERYAFSTGLNFSFINGKLEFPDQIIKEGDTLSGTMHRGINFLYLELPYTVKLSTKTFGKVSFFGQIGFATGFRLKAKAIDRFEQANTFADTEKYDYTSSTTLIRQSVLVGLGAELHLDQSSRIILGLGYSNSLNNVLTGVNNLDHSNEKGMLNYVELNLGFLF